MKTHTLLMMAAAAILELVTATARAEGNDPGPWYVGGTLAALTHVDGTDDYGVTGRVGGGYRFNRYFSAEVDYARVLDTNLTQTTIDGVEVAGRGEVPITDALSAFGRVGVLDWRRKFGRFDAGDGHDLTTGLGMRYAVTSAFSLTGSFDYYNDVGLDSGDGTRQVNLGAQLSF